MKPEHAAILDDALMKWHYWQEADKQTRGYAPRAAGFEGYRCSRQHDDTNGALDTDLDASRSAAVNFQVEEMRKDHPVYVYAIYANARNLCTGRAVWTNPSLPADTAEREQVIRDARLMICHRLVNAGVI